MSVAARGKINDMARRKERIPEGWALDPHGKPTTDPVEALKGFGLPMGQYKGYGLAVAVDILSGVLTGGGYSTDVRSLVYHWEEQTNVGHFFIVIDAARFLSLEALSESMKRMYRNLREAPPINPEQPVLISGEQEAKLEMNRREHGIPMDPRVFEILKGLTEGKYDYEIPKF
jgi:LDH2 family malate/lactate/ureidoglycolate dehydrogenase